MPRYMSPLDDTFIRFDAAADLIASRDPAVTPVGIFEVLVRATWQGRFEPSDYVKMSPSARSEKENPENWLHMPIVAPRHLLTAEQAAMCPRPYEYYAAGRSTLISVMYTEGLLPGEMDQWKAILEPRGTAPLDTEIAYDALIRTPLSKYSEAGREYFRGLYVPRKMLQTWLDKRSSKFSDLFATETVQPHAISSSSPNECATKTTPTKGRPRFSSRKFIREHAIALKLAHPDMPHKIIAHKVRQSALDKYDKAEVWEESTIYHKLGRYFKDLPIDKSKLH